MRNDIKEQQREKIREQCTDINKKFRYILMQQKLLSIVSTRYDLFVTDPFSWRYHRS